MIGSCWPYPDPVSVSCGQGVAYVLVVGRALWAAFYSTHFREPWTEGGERQLSAELASREVIAKLPHAGVHKPTQTYISECMDGKY